MRDTQTFYTNSALLDDCETIFSKKLNLNHAGTMTLLICLATIPFHHEISLLYRCLLKSIKHGHGATKTTRSTYIAEGNNYLTG